ncbi:MAG: hypothetical protein SFV54_15515 [Bryobacteraceae bacterium]|nr:hypothetical protein [Bryobacteraceae bacterium]
MFKRLALVGLLLAAAASAKVHTFTITDRIQAGAVQLSPGEYKLQLTGSDAVLTDKNNRRIDVNAKVEEVERKFAQTSVTTITKDGIRRLEVIEVGGTRAKVVFE